MNTVLLSAVLLIGAVSAGVVGPGAPTCGDNETFELCFNPCDERKCTPEPFCPIPVECTPGCACAPFTYRNAQGKCVTEVECAGNPCEHIDCGCGEHCVVTTVCGRHGCTANGECQPL